MSASGESSRPLDVLHKVVSAVPKGLGTFHFPADERAGKIPPPSPGRRCYGVGDAKNGSTETVCGRDPSRPATLWQNRPCQVCARRRSHPLASAMMGQSRGTSTFSTYSRGVVRQRAKLEANILHPIGEDLLHLCARNCGVCVRCVSPPAPLCRQHNSPAETPGTSAPCAASKALNPMDGCGTSRFHANSRPTSHFSGTNTEKQFIWV